MRRRLLDTLSRRDFRQDMGQKAQIIQGAQMAAGVRRGQDADELITNPLGGDTGKQWAIAPDPRGSLFLDTQPEFSAQADGAQRPQWVGKENIRMGGFQLTGSQVIPSS
jgi:hypothetical protein